MLLSGCLDVDSIQSHFDDMANLSTPSSGIPSSYRAVPGRVVTKKWKEANTVDYEDDGWGDDGYGGPPPAQQDQRTQGWGPGVAQQPYQNPPGQSYTSDRTTTMRSTGTGRSWEHSSAGRPSFDLGDERRNFSSAGGFQDGPYPTTAKQEFPDVQHDDEFRPPMRGPRGPPPLHVQTGVRPPSREQGPYSAPYYGPDPRMNQYQDPRPGPFSAVMAQTGGRRSGSSGRPSQADIPGRRVSPARSASRGSQGSSPARQQLPPRKSSLSQQNPPVETHTMPAYPKATNTPPSIPAGDVKPLPFLRPIDIWKRHEEEQSERRSQESSRPSVDSSASKDPTAPLGGNVGEMVPVSSNLSDTLDTSKPKLAASNADQGRTSDNEKNILQQSASSAFAAVPTPAGTDEKDSEPVSATSEYSNRPDPVTAASIYSRPSVREHHEPQRQFSAHSPTTEPPYSVNPAAPAIDNESIPEPESIAEKAPPIPFKEHPAVPVKDVPSMSPTTTAAEPTLHHNTSHGYRSMVEQAFQDSQREPPTPVSVATTLPRSNSASTSEISPIVARNVGQSILPMAAIQPSIAEERENKSVSDSGEPILPTEQPPPVPFKTGYRRDTSVPSPGNSPARNAVVKTTDIPHEELGSTSQAASDTLATNLGHTTEGSNPSIAIDNNHAQEDRVSRFEKPLPSPDQASPDARSASSEYRHWQSQRKQFNNQMGIQTDSPSTAGIPSPISRTESPSKGTVRDIAGRLENNSGRASPIQPEITRPTQNRLESFRPSIPGGWQSYSTNTPQQQSRSISPERPSFVRPEMPVRTETTESQIPRAGPPKAEHENHTSRSAFAAAAVAGTALAGAFSGYGSSQKKNDSQYPHEQSDSESESTQPISRDEPNVPEARAFADATSTGPAMALPPSPLPPPPLPKDTPKISEERQPASEYFPAPLNTKRSSETRTPARPSMSQDLGHDVSPNEEDNDRLTQEIEQSLTPRSSHYGPGAPGDLRDGQPSESSGRSKVLTGTSTSSESTLPREYDTYWKNNDSGANKFAAQESPQAAKNAPKPGFLDQRFSWEKGESPSDDLKQPERSNTESMLTPQVSGSSDFEAGSPETIRASARSESPISRENSRSETPVGTSAALAGITAAPLAASALHSRSNNSPTTPVQGASSSALQSPIRDGSQAYGHSTSTSAGAAAQPMSNIGDERSFPKPETREIPFRQILSMENPNDKMRAYAANQQHFSTSDGGLEKWLQSTGQSSPDNAAILSSNGKLSKEQIEALQSYRPSPAKASMARLTSGTFSGPSSGGSGTKQIQQDGKRLVSAAGKFSKGLLAKGKDKLRTSSAADKENRRRSSGPMPGPIPEESPQHSSTTFSAPPQIPEQSLNISRADSWSLPFENLNAADAASKDRDLVSPIAVKDQPLNIRPPNQSSYLAPVLSRVTSGAAAPVPSPKVSVISRTDDRELPSRSISEVTRDGGERSPFVATSQEQEYGVNSHNRSSAVEDVATGALGLAAAGAATAALTKHKDDLATSSGFPATSGVEDSLNTTPKNATHIDPQTDGEDGYVDRMSTDPKLGLRQHSAALENKRPSEVSNMSDPEQGHRTQEIPSRGVGAVLTSPSPDDERRAQTPVEPGSRYDNQMPTRQVEPSTEQAQSSPSRGGPRPQILPIADLSARRRDENQSPQPRPFSFAASNSVVEPINQNASMAESRNVPSNVNVPANPHLNKEWSNVSVEEVPDESRAPGNLISKSYSRPFGSEPNVENHPAFRPTPTPTDRAQMYSSEGPLANTNRESPLPPANRPVEDVNKYRQDNRSEGKSEEQYRIPGPYVQEYRSPKHPPQGLVQRPWPVNQQQQGSQMGYSTSQSGGGQMGQSPSQMHGGQVVQSSNQPQHFGHIHAQPSQQQQYGQRGPPQNQQQPQPRLDQQSAMLQPEKPKHRTIGGLFRTRSKSGSRSGRQDSVNESNKASGLFKTKSRQDSVSSSQRSQSLRQSESRDQVSGLPHMSAGGVNGSKQRSSKEMFRSSTFGSGSGLEEPAKKKRHSGLGGLFSRGSKSTPQRSSTTQSTFGRPSKLGASQQGEYTQQVIPNQQGIGGPGRQSPENFRGAPPPPSGYYGPQNPTNGRGRQQEQYPVSGFPHGPDSVGGQYPAGQQARFPEHGEKSQPFLPNTMSQSYQQQPQLNQGQSDQRPRNLHIDTGDGSDPSLAANRSQYPTTVPSTAPAGPAPSAFHPQSKANPAIYSYDSFQGRSPSAQPTYTQPQPQSQSQSQTQPPRTFHEQAKAPTPQPTYTTTTAPLADTQTNTHAHVVDLHKRSRSPRYGRQPSDDAHNHAANADPAAQLGTFKNRSPAGGVERSDGEGGDAVQEKPWRIDLPEAEEREREAKRRSRQMLIERGGAPSSSEKPQSPIAAPTSPAAPQRPQTVGERMLGMQPDRAALTPSSAANMNRDREMRNPATGAGAGKEFPVAELPGSKAEGYESDEEISMSATAYPGQEWMPYGAQEIGYGKWDD